jgi:hypothetical protein
LESAASTLSLASRGGVEAVRVFCSLSWPAMEARGFELSRRPLLHRPVAGVVHATVGFPSCLLQRPWWWLRVCVLGFCGGGFSRGAPLWRLMAVSSHHGVRTNGSRAVVALLWPLESTCAPSPSGAPRRRCCSPTPEVFILEEDEDGGLDHIFQVFPRVPYVIFRFSWVPLYSRLFNNSNLSGVLHPLTVQKKQVYILALQVMNTYTRR